MITLLKFKRLSEVHERCNLCVIELECFEESSKNESLQKAMHDEIEMRVIVPGNWLINLSLVLNGL